MTVTDQIKAVQSAVGVTPDGDAGPITWGAIAAKLCPPAPDVSGDPENPSGEAKVFAAVDSRSETNIATLLTPVQPVARQFIQQLLSAGIDAKVICGTRSYAEQDDLYEQGRSKPGSVVTHAKGGYSNHNFGIAFDIGIFDSGKYLDDSPLYVKAGAIGKALGLEWGGDWQSIQDQPHFELRPPWAQGLSESAMLSAMRDRHSSGEAIFV